MARPALPQGTRDFAPETVRKRNYIFQTIRTVFELYGFQPLETPAMENLETLMGKYGDEGDKLIFRILNNGLNDPANAAKSREAFENLMQGKNDRNLTERALRYDLTIPFARFVAMNHGQLVFPFKRYQVQPVWRADRPQRGRYREFYQCDADVVGSLSLLNEVELAHIYHDVFTRLRLAGYQLRINSRKILAALVEKCGGPSQLTAITIAIDKLDKIGIDKVQQELLGRGLASAEVAMIRSYLDITGTNRERLEKAAALLGDSPSASAGIQELEFILGQTEPTGIPIQADFTLARGLNYYTGVIFEAKAPPQVKIGSIGGGGRYDDLTGLFGLPGMPGVGISFGVDRIYDVLDELQLFPAEVEVSTQVMFLNTGDTGRLFAEMQLLRGRGIRCELFHEPSKIDKQYKYAERKKIPFVISLENEGFKIKDIRSGKVDLVSDLKRLNF